MLTLSRLGMAGILMALLLMDFPSAKSLALLTFVLAGITDYLDGSLARNVYGVTAFGRLMDPLTDKVIVCAAFICFVDYHLTVRGYLDSAVKPRALVPAWIVVIIISREFMVTGLRLLAVSKGEIISAGKWGKHKTVWQILAIAVLLVGLSLRHDVPGFAGARFDLAFWLIAQGVAVAVAMITVTSGAMYFFEHKELINRHL